jgi:hypothetical protein
VILRAVANTQTLTLRVERHALEVQPDGSLRQTLAQPMADVKTCTQAAAGDHLCEHQAAAFPAGSLVRFEAVATGTDGATASEAYFFAAGHYPQANGAVPIRLKTDTVRGLDVIFIGTTDLPPDSLRQSLDDVVHNLYFKYDPLRQWRGVYNFYYSRVAGEYRELCDFREPTNMAVLEATGDAVVFLHRAERQDCQIGKRISSELSNEKSLIHETGHVLFDLQDEYCCGSSYQAQPCMANLWSSATTCRAEAPALNYPVDSCVQLASGTSTRPFWRVDPDGDRGCIMDVSLRQRGSHFQRACDRRIEWRHQKCASGLCFTSPPCP